MHVLPKQNLFTSVEKMIHSKPHKSPTPFHCQNPCCIFGRG
ncbi:hypothetical protein ES332_D03G156700v1 [Gossypium tomentosum]|uniref:Uncharacterized protein n=1 Tax=Gossypium tomentosum TaxID=34277 RepID=A0A5D2LMW0_GOSTO|nr:hypothetical protein ES332_D03G156700v1 [Gossypium tomentosum]